MMSKTTDYIITLQEDISHAECLADILILDLKYQGENGTPTEVQDIFRKAKYDQVMKGLEKINMEWFAFKFYNYSMQGLCQILLDKGTEDRLERNLKTLAEFYNLPLDTTCVDVRQDAVVLTLDIHHEGRLADEE